jgi:hypothetical protein
MEKKIRVPHLSGTALSPAMGWQAQQAIARSSAPMLRISNALQNQTSIGLRRKPNWSRRAWQTTVVGLVSIVILFLVAEQPSEPGYAGKTLTQWLLNTNADWVWIPNDFYGHIHDELWFKIVESMKTSDTVSIDTARERGEFVTNDMAFAVRAIGTNGIPQLIRLMSSRPGRLSTIRGTIAERLPEKWGELFYPHHSRDFAERQKVAAFDGFTFLGTNAEPALPALSNLLFQGREQLQLTLAIANIGPKGISLLTNALDHQAPSQRNYAALALGLQYEAAKSAVPALLFCVERGNANYDVLGALGRIGCDDPRLVPALMGLLEAKGSGTNPKVATEMAFLLLGLQREKARVAAPLLIAKYRLLEGDANAVAGRRLFRRILKATAPDLERQLPPCPPDEDSETWP